MIKLPYELSRVPKSKAGALKVGGSHTLNITLAEILKSAITVGKRTRDIHITPGFSVYEALYRWAIIAANLRRDQNNYLIKSTAYKLLDPSEKGFISYYIGMTMAKLYSEYMGVPWLLHFDIYRKVIRHKIKSHSASTHPMNTKRPDLIGLKAANQWVLWEAKGRSNGFEKAVIVSAKQQIDNIATVRGHKPHLGIASHSFFFENQLRTYIQDPEPTGNVQLEFPEISFIRDYYKPIFDLLDASKKSRTEFRGKPLVVAKIDILNVTIGLNAEIFGLMKGETNEVEQFLALADERLVSEEDGACMGEDGVYLKHSPQWMLEHTPASTTKPK